ncbi:CASP-like protein 1C1 [Wolffia australiana]
MNPGRERTENMDSNQGSTRDVICIRLSIVFFTASSALLMGLNKETSQFGAGKMEFNYTSISVFKFSMIANAIVSGYFLLSIVFFFVPHNKMHIVYGLDGAASYVAMLATASLCAIAQVAVYGELSPGWSPVCEHVPHFCHQMAFSLGSSAFGCTFCYLNHLNSLSLEAP